MIVTNARILTFDSTNRVLDSGSVEIRPDGAIGNVSSARARGKDVIDAKGKAKRVYPWYATPWEILRQLPGLAGHLKPGVTIQDLERESRAKTDTAAAKAMQAAKEKLFISFQRRRIA